jgi:hypothetical protein
MMIPIVVNTETPAATAKPPRTKASRRRLDFGASAEPEWPRLTPEPLLVTVMVENPFFLGAVLGLTLV